MYANRQNLRALKEIGVEEHDGDVRLLAVSGNTAVSCMRNEKYAIIALIYGRIAEIFSS